MMLESLRYPGGVDFYPWVIQLLMVVTWTFHMLFVNLLIGGLGLGIYGFFKKDANWNIASITMTQVAKVSFSLAIVFGVAPLLFTQIIYDGPWYTANNLSASWVMAFIPILIVSYYMLYVFYFKNKLGAKKSTAIFPILSILLVVAAGGIMHIFSYQELFPEKWVDWYTSNGTTMNTDGWNIYAFNLPRYLLFLLLSFFITGMFMTIYSWYYRNREDKDQEYLQWFAGKGYKISLISGILTFIDALYYFSSAGIILHPLILMGLVFILGNIVSIYLSRNNLVNFSRLNGVLGLISILSVSIMRETVRFDTMQKFNSSIYDYKTNIDSLAPILFFGTLVVGGTLITYMLTLAYKSGKAKEQYAGDQDETIKKQWNFSVFIYLLYISVFIGTGIIIISKNYF